MKEFFDQYRLPIIFGGLGLIISTLFITIGFFKTLLIIILTGAGIALGVYLQLTGILDKLFNKNNY